VRTNWLGEGKKNMAITQIGFAFQRGLWNLTIPTGKPVDYALTNMESLTADIRVVIPVFNQLSYTANCVESLNRDGVLDSQIVIVNNASTDGTAEFLAGRPEIRAIHNPTNRGCGFAFNQGIKANPATWTVVLNNDVLVAPNTLAQLIRFAGERKFDIVSPAMCEYELDYDFLSHAREFVRVMSPACRRDIAFAVYFMVHRRVFDSIGFFDDDPKLGGYEDDEFFRRARSAGFQLATTGCAFIHHFGGMTQKSIKASFNQPNMSLGDRAYYRKKTGQTWPKRKWTQLKIALRSKWWKTNERMRYGRSLHEKRIGGEWHYC
jgi:N-acetylglucosaminyl-diphospho-decaprenol L-rhamnosyltransferase